MDLDLKAEIFAKIDQLHDEVYEGRVNTAKDTIREIKQLLEAMRIIQGKSRFEED